MKRIAIILGALFVSLVGLAMPAHAATPQVSAQASTLEVSSDFHYVISARYNDCLVIVGGSPVNSNPIWHYPCDLSPQNWERWSFESQGAKFLCDSKDWFGNCLHFTQYFLYRFHNELTGKCIEPHNGGIDSGTHIDEHDCTNDLRQSWFVSAGPNGGVYFFNARAFDKGQKLRVIDAAPADQDLQVRLWTFNDSTAQEWFVP